MTVIETLTHRNEAFAKARFSQNLKMMPSLKTMIIGCVDPRVDPAEVLGLAQGETAIIRNVGGRITPATFETLAMLRLVSQAAGGDLGPGWNLILLHHTDCGITRLHGAPDLLGKYFGAAPSALESFAIDDPRRSLAVDIAALKANPAISGELLVSGLMYDVKTGLIETVAPPAPLRPQLD